MKVTLKEWNAIATWHWDMPEDEVCGICRVQFDGTCPTCKFPGDECSLRDAGQMRPLVPYGEIDAYKLVLGANSEKHCLMTWIQQESSKGLCPMCRQSMITTSFWIVWIV
ncbi:anaphase promoting complex subunit Apc11 [Penicillium sp. IBT 18751x]|nr:anaphase promoting complex subunit Apc11 [Penicillium sp. IBT 18751x]